MVFGKKMGEPAPEAVEVPKSPEELQEAFSNTLGEVQVAWENAKGLLIDLPEDQREAAAEKMDKLNAKMTFLGKTWDGIKKGSGLFE